MDQQLIQLFTLYSRKTIGMQIEQPQNIEQNEDIDSNEEDKPIEKKQDDEITEHKTLNHNSLYYTFLQRYFTTYQTERQYLHVHSNGVVMISIKLEAYPSKPVQINDVLNFQQVKGKRKRGGLKVYQNTVIVEIVCEDGSKKKVYCLAEGTIIQKNVNLTLEKLSKPEGYIAIIMPSKKFKIDPNTLKLVPLPQME